MMIIKINLIIKIIIIEGITFIHQVVVNLIMFLNSNKRVGWLTIQQKLHQKLIARFIQNLLL